MTSTRKQIQEDFNKVISYSQGLACPNTGPLFDQWYESKKDFISAFNLIWESKTPVVRCLSLSMNRNGITASTVVTYRVTHKSPLESCKSI